MTNQKMSLGEKIGCGVMYAGLVGAISTFMFIDLNPARKYKTLVNGWNIESEVKYFDLKELSFGNQTILKEYSVFREHYKKDLESKLQELRASPQYVVEEQKCDEDYKSALNKLCLGIISIIIAIGAGNYVEKTRKRLQKSQPSGASK